MDSRALDRVIMQTNVEACLRLQAGKSVHTTQYAVPSIILLHAVYTDPECILVQAFDFASKCITLQSQHGSSSSSSSPEKRHYDLLVGADGVGSQVWPNLQHC